MRTQQVAELAGVTVRTLRHYHQIGVLPEPARHANGYRDYGLADVARLLRIRRLAALGVPLDRISSILASTGDVTDDGLLDELDRALVEQIALLRHQRRMLGELRGHRGRPDIPPEISAVAEPPTGGDPSFVELDRDAAVLLHRLLADRVEPAAIRQFAEQLSELRRDDQYAVFAARFEALPASAGQAEIDAVVDHLTRTLVPRLAQVLRGEIGDLLRAVDPRGLPPVDEDPRLNDAQAAVLRRIGDAL